MAKTKKISGLSRNLLILFGLFIIIAGSLIYIAWQQKSSADVTSQIVISDIKIQNITENSADVSWKTNIPTFGIIGLSNINAFVIDGNQFKQYIEERDKVLAYNHQIRLGGLKSYNQYNNDGSYFGTDKMIIKIVTKDYFWTWGKYDDPNQTKPGQKSAESSAYYFTASSTGFPVIYNVRARVNADQTSVMVSWNTYNLARGSVAYKELNEGATEKTVSGTTLSRNFGLRIDGLKRNFRYVYQVIAKDAASQETKSNYISLETR